MMNPFPEPSSDRFLSDEEVEALDRRSRMGKPVQDSRIPKRYLHCSFDSWKPEKCNWDWKQVLEWDHEEQWLLVIQGVTRGTGKTHLATAIYRKLIKERAFPTRSSWWWDMLELLERSKDTFGTNETFEGIKKSCECQLLLLDGVGFQRTTEYNTEGGKRIFNTRYNHARATIVTTNMTDQDLRKWDPDIFSRMQEDAHWVTVPPGATSVRATIGKTTGR